MSDLRIFTCKKQHTWKQDHFLCQTALKVLDGVILNYHGLNLFKLKDSLSVDLCIFIGRLHSCRCLMESLKCQVLQADFIWGQKD